MKEPFILKTTGPFAVWFFAIRDEAMTDYPIAQLPYARFTMALISLGAKIINTQDRPLLELPKNFKYPKDKSYETPFFEFRANVKLNDLIDQLPKD